MTVYDIPNVTVIPIGTIGFRIIPNEGYYIKLPEYGEFVYKTYAILEASYDFSTVQIVAGADLPEGAEILGDTSNDHEVM